MAHGHTPYAKTRIGAGPHGETLVFSLTTADKAKGSGIPSIDMYDRKLEPANDFYGEMVRDGRLFVFSCWEDMEFVTHDR